MNLFDLQLRLKPWFSANMALSAWLALWFGSAALAQQAAPAQAGAAQQLPAATAPATTPAPEAAPQVTQPETTAPAASGSQSADQGEAPGGISEEELKRMLVGKPLFLRGGYLFDTLSYNEHGALIGRSARASYTLCAIQIDKVRLTRRKVELEGARYGLHFLGALAYEDPTKAVDRVKVTPKKKALRITIDRELVVKPKKVKGEKGTNGEREAEPAAAPGRPAEMSAADEEKNETKGEIAAAPAAERPAEPNSVTTTTSPAHSAMVLKEALDKIFAESIDERMIAAMPDFWKLYYQAAAAKTDYRPADPAVMRQNTVDRKAKLISTFEPASNEYAQTYGVAGMSLYHVVIGADGKPGEIAVARPIGFGLDENAVDAIRNAKFEPAMKDGKPVPVLLDLVVQFRIYSKRTAAAGTVELNDKATEPVLPGPYSVQRP